MRANRHFLLLSVALITAAAPSRSAPGDITLQSVYLPPGIRITDVWGYSAGGRNYAVVGEFSTGVYVIDVTNPLVPTMAKDLTALGFAGFDVKVWDHYIYVCNGSGNGTTSRVIDVADLANPIVSAPFQSAHNLAVDPAGYLVAELFGIRFYDIRTTPMSPAQLWSFGTGDAHDASVVGDLLFDFRGVFGTFIWDISNRSTPVLLGENRDPDVSYHHSGYPTSDGRHLFICDEKAKSPQPDITVWNIENPDTMIKVGSIEDPDATAHNLYIVDDLAFVSYYSAGFRVYDVSNPASPVLADEYDTSVFGGENFTGCFGVYPFTGSTLVYATDQVNGLYVFSVERDIPVPVAFTAFDARAGAGSVVLEWAVFADETFLGFRVYRRASNREVVISGVSPLPALERTYVDTGVSPGTRYEYTVAAVHTDGSEILSQTVAVDVPVGTNRLFQNHPNPFNPSTTISFELAAPGRVRMDVFDTLGRRVRTIVDGVRPAGVSSVVWDGADQSGRPVVSGLYFYRLTIGNAALTRRMVLLK